MILFASDLDRTLIYSPAALWLGDTEDPELQTVPVLFKDGMFASFMTEAAAQLLADLPDGIRFVPTTARGMYSYRRITLPGAPYEYAITSTGGNILRHGEQDHDWSATIRRALTHTAPVGVVHGFLNDPAFSWILGLGVTDGLFLHSRIERAAMPADWLLELEARCLGWGWEVSVQGRKLYCTPLPVDKRLAVEEIRLRTGCSGVIAAGDSLLDKGMLETSDTAYRPSHGELAEQGWLAPNLTVTTARGIRAGEEILQDVTHAARTVPAGVRKRVLRTHGSGQIFPDPETPTTYAEAKRAEYPPQDEKELLIEFTTELLARRKFAATGHAGVNWENWIGADEDTRDERMEPFLAHATVLSDFGMLSWPDAETPGIGWTVEGPGQMRGLNAAPALDWIQSFGRNPKRAVAYFRACRTTGQPCRLTWAFQAKKGLNFV